MSGKRLSFSGLKEKDIDHWSLCVSKKKIELKNFLSNVSGH